MQPRMGGMIQTNIPDVETLFASYMPYVVGGGLFVPSKQAVKMGDEVFVLGALPEQTQKIPLTGKVIWISQKQNGTKPQGFGIQLAGEKGIYFKSEAERLLAGLKTEGRRSYTM